MGTFNTLAAGLRDCLHCGSQVKLRLQFKYGHCDDLTYHIGDTIEWGWNDKGPRSPKILVYALSESCDACGEEIMGAPFFQILFVQDKIVLAEPIPEYETSVFRTEDTMYVPLCDEGPP